MTNPNGMHLCPTRSDGAETLIARFITEPQCQQHQREHFHKCPTCVHYNARNLLAPPPPPPQVLPSTVAQQVQV